MTAITEGVTPDGDNLQVSAVTATVSQYGNWIRLSDMLELAAIDRNVEQATKLLGAQAGRTLDTITREELNGGTNVLYAPKVSGGSATEVLSRSDITADCRLNVDVFYQAAAQLEAMNASRWTTVCGHHSPASAYDLMRSEEWIDCHKYAAPEYIYNGEIGKLGNIRFVKSTEAKIWGPAEIVPGYPRLTVKTAVFLGDDQPGRPGSDSAEPVRQPGGGSARLHRRRGQHGHGSHLRRDGRHAPRWAARFPRRRPMPWSAGRVAARMAAPSFPRWCWAPTPTAPPNWKTAAWSTSSSSWGYGDDPLNQRSSVGWKATKAAKRLVEAYLVRIESGNSYSDKAKSN